jgi:hypothetical protein
VKKEISDPIEQQRIIAEFNVKQRLRDLAKKKRMRFRVDWAWMMQSGLYLGLILLALFLDQRSGGKFPWRYAGALPAILWLWALAAKVATIESKIDKLTELLEEKTKDD